MLRNRLPDEVSIIPDPTLGVNYRLSPEDLQPGQAYLMRNCYFDGVIRMRRGMGLLTPSSQGSLLGTGGCRAYFANGSKVRVVGYDIRLATVSDGGVVTTVTTSLVTNSDVHLTPWSITDAVYVCTGTNSMGSGLMKLVAVTGGVQAQAVTGTNAPPSPVMVKPFADRLFALQGDAVVPSNPLVDNTWASTNSIWSAYRGPGRGGEPTAIHLHSATGEAGDPLAMLLMFYSGSTFAITGTLFGSAVDAASAPTGWDAQIRLLDPDTGTESPYSPCTIPGMGTGWVNQKRQVMFLAFGESIPRVIGDPIESMRTDVTGLNQANLSALGQIQMVYHDRKLKLMFPTGSNTYSTIQYWLDVHVLQQALLQALPPEQRVPVAWSGPHTGMALRRMWVEDQSGDGDDLYGLEGSTTTGLFVYRLNRENVYTDQSGLATSNVVSDIRPYFHDFGTPLREKRVNKISIEAAGNLNDVTLTVRDLHGTVYSGLTFTDIHGMPFQYDVWNDGDVWNNGDVWSDAAESQRGLCWPDTQTDTMIVGDRLSFGITANTGPFDLQRIWCEAQVRRQEADV